MYRIRLDNIQLEDTAAFTIQNSWKRHQANANQYKLEQEAAARRIQAIARGKRGRSDFQAKELLKEEQLEAGCERQRKAVSQRCAGFLLLKESSLAAKGIGRAAGLEPPSAPDWKAPYTSST